jgi:CRISPR-associated protein Csd2
LTQAGEEGYEIYVQHQGILANQQKRGFDAVADGKPTDRPNDNVRRWMCKTFYDVRTFGAVMTTGKSGQKKGSTELQWNAGQVRGPMQLTFARSIDPIFQLDMSITRVALTNAGDTQRGAASEDQESASSGTFGRKAIVPYGLYRAHGFFNPHFAQRTGVTEEDLNLFWQALQQMWDLDRSASRGMLACRGLYVFSHESSLGNAPAHELFDHVQIERNGDVVAPRSFRDYYVTVDENVPNGVTLTRLVG